MDNYSKFFERIMKQDKCVQWRVVAQWLACRLDAEVEPDFSFCQNDVKMKCKPVVTPPMCFRTLVKPRLCAGRLR